MVIPVQERLTPPVIVHAAWSGFSTQVRPEGRVSVIVTPVAIPWPAFDTVIVYVAVPPAEMTGVEVDFWIDRPGQRTVVLAEACIGSKLSASAVAVFAYALTRGGRRGALDVHRRAGVIGQGAEGAGQRLGRWGCR